jgi:RimJ/RimL family protein N-acetyltransferase
MAPQSVAKTGVRPGPAMARHLAASGWVLNQVAGPEPKGCNGTVPPPASPPDCIDAGPVILWRHRKADAPSVAAAVRKSLVHLAPWMPWATPEAGTVEVQTARIVEVDAGWARGTDFVYSLRAPAHDAGDAGAETVLGVLGLHRRGRRGAIEVGYWTHVDYQGRGYMSAAAKVATEAAAALEGVERVEIHTDEANLRSAAIPQKLGFRLDRVDTRPPQAPGESGRLQIWVRP